MVQVDLHCGKMEKWVPKTDNIHAHLSDMALLHEHLSGMGVTIHNEDYASMVLMSLPDSYTTHLKPSQMLPSVVGAHSLLPTSLPMPLNSQTSISFGPTVTPSWIRKTLHFTCWMSTRNQKKGNSSQKDVQCFNCCKRGHFACDCHGPSGV